MARKKELPPGNGKPEASLVPAVPVSASGETRSSWNALMARRNELAAVVLFASVLVLRAPWILFSGRFWAEEATQYFSYARSHSFLDALTATHVGYYSFVPNVGGLLAAWVPLEWAPRATAAFTLLIYILPAWLILFTSIPGLVTPLRKAAALALLLVVPANPEVYLNSVNCHFLLCAATGLVLISHHGSRAGHIGKCLLLVLAGMTGVVSTFLTPLFWCQWWRERRRERLTQAAILTLCALVEFVAICQAMEQGERHFRVNLPVIAGAAYAKLLAAPLAPVPGVSRQMIPIYQTMLQGGSLPAGIWLAAIVGIALFLYLCWSSRCRAARLMAAACIGITLLASPGSREAVSDQSLLNHLIGSIRYYYPPEFFLFLALLISLGPDTRLPAALKALGAVWLAAALAMGVFNFVRAPLDWPQMFSGPAWSPQIAQWRKDPSKPILIWPPPWQLSLPAAPGSNAPSNLQPPKDRD